MSDEKKTKGPGGSDITEEVEVSPDRTSITVATTETNKKTPRTTVRRKITTINEDGTEETEGD